MALRARKAAARADSQIHGGMPLCATVATPALAFGRGGGEGGPMVTGTSTSSVWSPAATFKVRVCGPVRRASMAGVNRC